uniref:hypothetical protein n=1 Tax=Paractinoplanes polyasparticus TaxID=2856853 RepID=UPI001C855955|nr:hypothetical protein [Actinoplanes polyasparticus]
MSEPSGEKGAAPKVDSSVPQTAREPGLVDVTEWRPGVADAKPAQRLDNLIGLARQSE